MDIPAAFSPSARTVEALAEDDRALAELDDEALLAAHATVAAHLRQAETLVALVAGEIARRSRRDDGYAGLAQRRGHGSAESLLQSLSPVTRADAAKLVAAGTLLTEAADASAVPREPHDPLTPPPAPWRAALARALAEGRASLAAADVVRRALEAVHEVVSADPEGAAELESASERLVAAAATLTIEQLRRAANRARDLLDEAGIARRELEQREQRYLKRWIRSDGMYQGAFLLDPDSGREVFAALDAITAPRRGGPRFVDPDEAARADDIVADSRSDEQLLADSLVDMVRLAGDADPGRLFGRHRPAVRVVVSEEALRGGGHGYPEGDEQPISREGVDRRVCDAGMLGVVVDALGQTLDVGRAQRLFTERQRTALAVRDGGCRFPGCDRPPSFCEAHHIVPWQRGGRTDVRDGVLLCRHHHMLLHNNHWTVLRDGASYWLRPPRSEDPEQRPRPMRPPGPVVRELVAAG